MKTIKIRIDVKKKLDEFSEGKSINKTMRILLENAKTYEHHNHELKFININMDDDLLDKLKKCKISPSESYSDAINRLLDEKMKK